MSATFTSRIPRPTVEAQSAAVDVDARTQQENVPANVPLAEATHAAKAAPARGPAARHARVSAPSVAAERSFAPPTASRRLAPERSFPQSGRKAAVVVTTARPAGKRAAGSGALGADALRTLSWAEMCNLEPTLTVQTLLAAKPPAGARFDARVRLGAQEANIVRLQACVRHLDSGVASAQAAAGAMRSDAAAAGRAAADAEKARAQVTAAEASAREVREYAATLQSYNKGLQSEVAALRESLLKETDARLALQQAAGEARGAAAEAQAQAQAASSAASSLERERAEAAAAAAQAAQALALAHSERDSARAETVCVAKEAEALRCAAAAAAERLAKEAQRAQMAEAAAADAVTERDGATAQRDVATAQIDALSRGRDAARTDMTLLQETVAASAVRAEAAERDARALRAQLDAAAADAADARGQAARAGASLGALQCEMAALKAHSGMAESQAADAAGRAQRLDATVTAQEQALEALRCELSLATADARAKGDTIASALQRCAAAELFAAQADAKLLAGEAVRARLHEQLQELRGNIRVVCRVRPASGAEAAAECKAEPGASSSLAQPPTLTFPSDRELRSRALELARPGAPPTASRCERERPAPKYTFAFDRVFDTGATQSDVFDDVAPVVQSALDGYRACIFAYGPTGSGKTYTMLGGGDALAAGVIPRALELLFATRDRTAAQGWSYAFTASALEVYNEDIHDLLAEGDGSAGGGKGGGGSTSWDRPADKARSYDIKLDASGEEGVADAVVQPVETAAEVAALLARAAAARATGRTACNARSSRSHMVLSLRLRGDHAGTGEARRGCLHLVDLAGSERLSKSGVEGEALKETQAINKSLAALGDVIAALASRAPHVPFRNSTLTRLLAPALGGDAKTLMLVNVAPTRDAAGETLCSLRFAAKVNSCELATQQRKGEIAGPMSKAAKR